METLEIILDIFFVLGFLLLSLATIMQYGKTKYSEGDLNGLKEGIKLGESTLEIKDKITASQKDTIKKQRELIAKQDEYILLLKEKAKE